MTAVQTIRIENNFEAWRSEARTLLAKRVPPSAVEWDDERTDNGLFGAASAQARTSPPLFTQGGGQREGRAANGAIGRKTLLPAPSDSTSLAAGRSTRRGSEEATQAASLPPRVPQEFISLAQTAACHRDRKRWSLLYRILFRLTLGNESSLLRIAVDDDIVLLNRMVRQVRRDRHKMTAFVRFRKIVTPAGEQYVAWYQPDHWIVRLAAPHFVSRFGVMRWSILTPDESADYDGRQVRFAPGVPRSDAPGDDELESLWLTYYANIFNPSRIKLDMMRREMPVRFWPSLPETSAIPQMLADAPRRVETMIKQTRGGVDSSTLSIPKTQSLQVLVEASKSCRACPWAVNCTQAVFGEGPSRAPIVFVGEQPGDQEDLAGRPFVGPAGEVFAEVLNQVGIDRASVYVTNAVKHFKFEPRGKRRIHQKPNARDIAACRPWLLAELEIVKPKLVVCLGATAAQSLLGPEVRITKDRGKVMESRWSPWTLVTWHPSALLRAPTPDLLESMRREFKDDLSIAAGALKKVC